MTISYLDSMMLATPRHRAEDMEWPVHAVEKGILKPDWELVVKIAHKMEPAPEPERWKR